MAASLGFTWRQKPPPGTSLDWGSEFTRGLVGVYSPHALAEGGPIPGQVWTPSGGTPPTIGSGKTGPMLFHGGSGVRGVSATLAGPANSTQSGATVLFLGRSRQTTSTGGWFGIGQDNYPQRFYAEQSGTTLFFGFGNLATTGLLTTSIPTAAQSEWKVWAFRGGPSGLLARCDGLTIGSTSTAVAHTLTSDVWQWGFWTTESAQVDYEVGYVWNRELSDGEIAAMEAAPYRPFAAPALRRFFLGTPTSPAANFRRTFYLRTRSRGVN